MTHPAVQQRSCFCVSLAYFDQFLNIIMISCNVMVSFSSKQEIHEALVFVTRGSGDIVELFLLVVSRTRPLGNECDS